MGVVMANAKKKADGWNAKRDKTERAAPTAEEIEMGISQLPTRSLGARCLILLLLPVVWTISSNVLFWLTFEPLFGGLDNPNSVGGALSIAFVGASLITYWLWRWRRRK